MKTHETFSAEEPVIGSSDRSFGIVFAVIFLTIGLAPIADGEPLRWWSLALGIAFLILAIFRPSTLKSLNRLWFRFGLLLNRILSPLLLGIIYFFVVVPTGILMRLLKNDLLNLKFDHKAKSYWIKRDPPGPEPETLHRQY